MSWKVTKYDKEVKAKMAKAMEAALRGCGELEQDSLASETHPVTGLLRNSWNYRTKEYQGPFGDLPMNNPKKDLSSDEQVSQPDEGTVRIGSNLQYAEPYNDRFKVLEKTSDQNNSRFGKVANAAYNKVIGK